jgi:hypothetical protein
MHSRDDRPRRDLPALLSLVATLSLGYALMQLVDLEFSYNTTAYDSATHEPRHNMRIALKAASATLASVYLDNPETYETKSGPRSKGYKMEEWEPIRTQIRLGYFVALAVLSLLMCRAFQICFRIFLPPRAELNMGDE